MTQHNRANADGGIVGGSFTAAPPPCNFAGCKKAQTDLEIRKFEVSTVEGFQFMVNVQGLCAEHADQFPAYIEVNK